MNGLNDYCDNIPGKRPLYQVMPDLTEEDYAILKASIQKDGVIVPIEYDENGNILDGHHRLRACRELGITDFPKIIRSGMTEAQKRSHARTLNVARRQLSREQKQEVIRQQLLETPERSDRQIADEVKSSPTTVGTIRHKMENDGQLSKLDSSIGADGKLRTRPATTLWEAESQARSEGINRPHVLNNSGNNEWYTPAKYIELARKVLGTIDVDPASCEYANRTVKAKTYYTADNSGLEKEWHGKVWMNPPYAADLVQKFADKMVCEYEAGNTSEAIVLVNNATETQWFNNMMIAAGAVAFPKGRITARSAGKAAYSV